MPVNTRTTPGRDGVATGLTQGSTPDPLSIATGTLVPSENDSIAILTANLEAARRRIAELEQAQEQRRLADELAAAEARVRQLEDLEETGSNTPTSERPAVVHTASLPFRRAPKTRELPTYKGRNIKEAQDFFYQAELKWREDNDITWRDDAAKVTHCVSCFEGIARDIWKRKERRAGVNNTTWEEFVEFMKDAISDPENRNLDALTKHDEARQRENQSVQSFVSYLDSLEDELGIDDERQRRNNIFAKIRPEIRQEISLRGDVPTDREKLIAQAVRIENHFRMYRDNTLKDKKKTGRNRNEGGSLDGKRRRSESPPDPQGPATGTNTVKVPQVTEGSNRSTRRRANVTCFKCKEEGHYASSCPQLVCANCGESGHKTYGCPKPRRPGNDRAQQ